MKKVYSLRKRLDLPIYKLGKYNLKSTFIDSNRVDTVKPAKPLTKEGKKLILKKK